MKQLQQPGLTPQQEAIRELHGRYERGELSFEDFDKALDKERWLKRASKQAQIPQPK